MRDALVIYAAAVATAAFGWNVWTWRQARRGITVRVALAAAAYPERNVWCVVITAVNRGDHAANVTGAGLVMQDGSDGQWIAFGPLDISDLPGTIAPHDSASMFDEGVVAQESFDLQRPLVAWVRVATEDDPVRSKPATLLGPSGVLPS